MYSRRRVACAGTVVGIEICWLPSFVAPSEYKAKVEAIKAEAARCERELEEDHYGALVPYIPPGKEDATETVLSLLAARRPEIDPRDVVATGGDETLRALLEEFGPAGFGLLRPDELEGLRPL